MIDQAGLLRGGFKFAAGFINRPQFTTVEKTALKILSLSTLVMFCYEGREDI